MDEFIDRTESQRRIIAVVNRASPWREDLFGLSEQAIVRWASSNTMSLQSEVVVALMQAADLLGTLALRSQDPVSSDYREDMMSLLELEKELAEKLNKEIKANAR